MKAIHDNIHRHTRDFQNEFKNSEGPLITFQVSDKNDVKCKHYHGDIQEIIAELGYDHKGTVEFHDADHRYDDCLSTIADYLKDEGKIKDADIEGLDHVGGGFEDYKERVEELYKQAGCEMGEMVEMELKEAAFYNDVYLNGNNTCDITMFNKDGMPNPKTHQYFDRYGDLLRHILSLGGDVYGAVIHDKETKELLSGENTEILKNITDSKIKEKIINEISNIVRDNKEHYPKANSYLMTKENNNDVSREN